MIGKELLLRRDQEPLKIRRKNPDQGPEGSPDLEIVRGPGLEKERGLNPGTGEGLLLEGHLEKPEVDHRIENVLNPETGNDRSPETGEELDPFLAADQKEDQFLEQG